MRRWKTLAPLAIAAVLLLAADAVAQTKEAVRTKYQEPVYPDNLFKTQRQGNVLLVGRIDVRGRVRELHAITTSHKDFVPAALEAVKAWEFRPAVRDGKPIEIFLNVGVRFRIQNEKRGEIANAIPGDVAISPADASGKRSAPEGFPIRLGKDPALRAEVLLDVPPMTAARNLSLQIEAVSPSGKRVSVFQPPVPVPAKATEVRIPVVVQVGEDWEEGVWMLRFAVNGSSAGGGQFWVARDPARFSFVIPAP